MVSVDCVLKHMFKDKRCKTRCNIAESKHFQDVLVNAIGEGSTLVYTFFQARHQHGSWQAPDLLGGKQCHHINSSAGVDRLG